MGRLHDVRGKTGAETGNDWEVSCAGWLGVRDASNQYPQVPVFGEIVRTPYGLHFEGRGYIAKAMTEHPQQYSNIEASSILLMSSNMEVASRKNV